MTGLTILTDPVIDIDYSTIDGRIRSFQYDGETLYDEDMGVEINGWKDTLVSVIKEQGLNIDDGRGLHAFVVKMIIDGDFIEEAS